jgi:hypothetical protein
MTAANTDLFMQVGLPGSATTLASPGYNQGDPSINVESLDNWEDGELDTGVIFAIDTFTVENGQEKRVPDSLNIFSGVISGANSVGSLDLLFGTPQDYAAGADTRVYIMVSSLHTNRIVKGILAHANQDGSLKPEAVQAALGLGAGALNGWNPLGFSPASVTANGNRSYDLVFNGQDLSTTLSPGMRLRTTRSTAAPVQCTALNGSNHYWSKSSPSGMTFTDDFVLSAYVKLDGYKTGDMVIASRYNGTSGWVLFINTNGQVVLRGYNGGSGNFSDVTSYGSVPLNRWVHVAAQLDMSAFTATTTTSYVMFDGLDVPALVSRTGTNPTALVQAGNLEIGSKNGGNNYFPGKIAQLAIYNAKVTQATIRGSLSQALAGNEASLVSAYSFNNSVADLTSTGNTLSPNNAVTATSADSPFGGQGNVTISSTLDYAIVMKVTYSTNTTLTVQVPEGCTIPTTGSLSAVAYSSVATPYGFPGAKRKWRLVHVTRTLQSVTLGSYAPVPGMQIQAPVGEWHVRLDANAVQNTVTNPSGIYVTVSDSQSAANPAIADPVFLYHDKTAQFNLPLVTESADGGYYFSALTPLYALVARFGANTTGMAIDGVDQPSKITLDNAYV